MCTHPLVVVSYNVPAVDYRVIPASATTDVAQGRAVEGVEVIVAVAALKTVHSGGFISTQAET